jgi:hypothetical protein
MTAVLGWQPGDRLTFTPAAVGVVVARRDPGGMVTMPAKPYLVIPAALRRRCGLRPGDHVLVGASPGEDTLTAYSFAVVDQTLRAHARVPAATQRAARAATRTARLSFLRALLPSGHPGSGPGAAPRPWRFLCAPGRSPI